MKKLMMLAILSVSVFSTPVSESVIVKAKQAVTKAAKSYFGQQVYVSYSSSNAEEMEVFFNAYWTEESVDVYYDEGEPVYIPYKTECEQGMVYLVDKKKVLLTQDGYCK